MWKTKKVLSFAMFSLLVVALTSGCGPLTPLPGLSNQMNNSLQNPENGSAGHIEKSLINICSKLDFANVAWAPSLTPDDRQALMLALNIGGSFEGSSDWSTLSNNFDGQGLSMGLLNQTLGTGSLQPLWALMRDNHLGDLQRIFSSAHLTSLLNFLSSYNAASSQGVSISSVDPMSGLFRLSSLDLESAGINILSFADQSSVKWALGNIYSDAGVTFKPDWQAELQALGRNPNYISYQIQAAYKIHLHAKRYMQMLGISELRSYLFSFDIVTQNGSFYANDIADYTQYLAHNPNATDTQKLVQILDYRLREVRTAYVEDVRSRKMSMINGRGTVHGVYRNLDKEYCYNHLSPYQ
jgi:hypothetical protein